MKPFPTVAKTPCGSCPYRCDVPSGIWHPEEYDKLPLYDGETWEQSPNLFMCHQKDGNLCAGWIASHGTDELLALRLHRVAPEVFDFVSPVPVFKSGAAARAHGLAEVEEPGPKALRMMDGIARLK